jgi:hypothetical protein
MDRYLGAFRHKNGTGRTSQDFAKCFAVQSAKIAVNLMGKYLVNIPARVLHLVFIGMLCIASAGIAPVMFGNELLFASRI